MLLVYCFGFPVAFDVMCIRAMCMELVHKDSRQLNMQNKTAIGAVVSDNNRIEITQCNDFLVNKRVMLLPQAAW